MTHEQLIRFAFAATVAPALFVWKHLEEKHGRLDMSDLQALKEGERKAVRNAMPKEFMVRVANELGEVERNEIAEMLGAKRMAKVHEVLAAILHVQAKTA